MDTTIKKVDSRYSPKGKAGQTYLVSGTRVAMRLWELPPGEREETTRDYELVGYVLDGSAELVIGDQTVRLRRGDSWVVPRGSPHRYRILERFQALEATSPPYHVHGRDG